MLERLMLAQLQECVFENTIANGSTPGVCIKISRKVNCDTAIRSSFTSQAAVLRNGQGSIIGVVAVIAPLCSVELVEAKAVKLGIMETLNKGWLFFTIEGDASRVISEILRSSNSSSWDTQVVYHDIKQGLKNFHGWSCVKVSRAANCTAHSMAKWAANVNFSGSILAPPFPFFVVNFGLGSGPTPPSYFFGLWVSFKIFGLQKKSLVVV